MTALIVISSITLVLVFLMCMHGIVARTEIIDRIAERVFVMLKTEREAKSECKKTDVNDRDKPKK